MNTAEKYGIEVVRPADVEPGDYYWKLIGLEHVPVGENGNQHHVFVDVYGLHGEELRGNKTVKVMWGWEEQKFFEESPDIPLDKPAPEHMANIPMNLGQKNFLSVTSPESYARELVRNLHTAHTDEGDDVRTGHHSFRVKFQLTEYKGKGGGDFNVFIRERIKIIITDLEEILKELGGD